MTERDSAGAPQQQPSREEPDASQRYHEVYRFANGGTAGRAYIRLQALVESAPIDLSVYRFRLEGVYHVAVLGAHRPPESLERCFRAITLGGEPARSRRAS